MTQPLGSGAPPLITETIDEPTPQIGEPVLAGQNPDFMADYIYCNNLVVAGSTVSPPSGVRMFAAGVTANPSTTSGTLVDLPEMTVTFTLQVITNVLAWFTGMFSHTSTGQQIAVAFVLDATAAVGTNAIQAKAPPNNGENLSALWMFPNVPPGTHTIKVQWSTQAATASNVGGVRYLAVLG